MKRLLHIASVAYLLFSSQFHDGCAAGPYDGECTGSATATEGRCRPAIVQVHGIDAAEKVVIRKQLRRGQVLKFFASLPPWRLVLRRIIGRVS
jgi:hypothetical protein